MLKMFFLNMEISLSENQPNQALSTTVNSLGIFFSFSELDFKTVS